VSRENVVVIQLDIRRAFDAIKHDVLVQVLESFHVPPYLVCALLRELSGCNMNLQMQGTPADRDVLLSNGGKQRGTETPSLWIRIADRAAQNAALRWKHEGLCITLDIELDSGSQQLTHLFWADDFYLLGKGIVEVERMFIILTEEIVKLGLTWKPSSLQALVTNPDCVADSLLFQASGTTWTIKIEPKIVALGVAIDNHGSTDVAFNHRLSQFIAHFEARSKVLCARRVPLKARIRRFYETCVRTLLYSAGGWTYSVSLLERLQKAAYRCLRRMFRNLAGRFGHTMFIGSIIRSTRCLRTSTSCLLFCSRSPFILLGRDTSLEWVVKTVASMFIFGGTRGGSGIVLLRGRHHLEWIVLPCDGFLLGLGGMTCWKGLRESTGSLSPRTVPSGSRTSFALL
jgi:hypothetical protein